MCFSGIPKELHCILFNGCSNSLEGIEGEKDKSVAGRIGQEAGYFGSTLQLWLRESQDTSVCQALFQVCLLVFSFETNESYSMLNQ